MSLYSLIGNKLHLQLQVRVFERRPCVSYIFILLHRSLPRSYSLQAFLSYALAHQPLPAVHRCRGGEDLKSWTLLRIEWPLLRLPDLWRRGHARRQESDTYRTPHEEARYWRLAERHRRRLYSGGTQVQAKLELGFKNTRSHVSAQLVEYYTPRLLPVYREMGRSGNSQEADAAFTISPKTYCKWHRMVFPDRPHPTLIQAARQIKQHSPRDLREILRISRLAPVGKAFREDRDQERYTTKYKKLWQAYLHQRSMDLVIVFE
ncbi:hypothetical protein EDD15DRAFT_2385311 [Pisolithus albus]|nr:hypothetical protein EDD15DRAFT_2385311 [Pisolithus albus]